MVDTQYVRLVAYPVACGGLRLAQITEIADGLEFIDPCSSMECAWLADHYEMEEDWMFLCLSRLPVHLEEHQELSDVVNEFVEIDA